MRTRRKHGVVARALVVTVAAGFGVLLNRGGGWIVYHDSVNYRLHDAGFGLLSDAAETSFALGPLLWAGGAVLTVPLLLGLVRGVASFSRLVGLHALTLIMLVCGLGSITSSLFLRLVAATMLLWVLALVLAAVSPARPVRLGAPPNGGPSMSCGNTQVWEGPPSLT